MQKKLYTLYVLLKSTADRKSESQLCLLVFLWYSSIGNIKKRTTNVHLENEGNSEYVHCVKIFRQQMTKLRWMKSNFGRNL